IFLDNQAAVCALAFPVRRKSGQHILLTILRAYEDLLPIHLHLRLHFEWIPGHHDIPGNEKADHLAKAA
ncbi:uncharacterized protein EI90DRAFT_2841778, partial [Cantharellus anzutake]|uniref:uncharacterized protein n=1 Tax=Cantharellus anzutake TaxID=1750568 RepID=UPI001905E764